jgi:ribosomal-protein-alanine N-acetyltransferase
MNEIIKRCDIYTERLCMRQLIDDDVDSYYEIMKKDEVGMWLASSSGKSYDETKSLIVKYSQHWKERGYGVWGVFDKQLKELLGHCGLNFLKETGEIELLYAFDPKFWGHGYATESALVSLEYAIGKLKLDRIIALAKPDNIRSINVIQKTGFKPIGTKEYFGMQLMCYELLLSKD